MDFELTLGWADGSVRHRERRICQGVDAATARLGSQRLADLVAGGAALPLCLPSDPALRIVTARRDWPQQLGGQRIDPRPGRWFPRLVLAGCPGFAAADREPMRVIDADPASITVDLNLPLAGRALAIEATALPMAQMAPAASPAATGSVDLLPMLLANGPGMQAALAERGYVSPQDGDLARADAGADADFYAAPRFVDHLDRVALQQLRLLQRRFLAPGMRVLDLMASCNSHLPDDAPAVEVSGLGLNADELASNPRLQRRVVHDLNADPALPFASGEFDLVLCALSVEYLVRPHEVFREVARVLRPGGAFLVSFAERWFPPKAIRLWSELHPFERIGLVLGYFAAGGNFCDLHTESLRGLARPPDDKYYRMTKLADPLYAVWGKARP